MKRIFTISGIFMLLLFSQNTFAQEKQSGDKIDYKSDAVKHNTKEKTIILQGNVVLKTKNISLGNAERVTIDEKNNTVTIYNPKDFKILYAKTVSKTGGSNKNIIVYNTKDESIIFQ
ncbi:LptA/OstA family protein [Chryseobacterium sp.]|uniref:LptA/OstA family protein n=1 Tax=Chryseobacterium sp. TaxID=1871047 RepID=UPI002FCB4438